MSHQSHRTVAPLEVTVVYEPTRAARTPRSCRSPTADSGTVSGTQTQQSARMSRRQKGGSHDRDAGRAVRAGLL